MKKSLLILSLVGFGITCFAQNKTSGQVPNVLQPKNVKAYPINKHRFDGSEISAFTNATQQVSKSHTNPNPNTGPGTVIGTTTYNLGTNSSVRNALVKNSDGTVSAVFTYSNQASSYSDRGTGYNYYSSTWGPNPTARIESSRTGWPSLTVLSDGSEIGVSHNTAMGATEVYNRPVKGTGAWTENIDSLVPVCTGMATYWPRIASGGSNGMTVHIIGVSNTPVSGKCDGQSNPLRYSRSLDGGVSWDIMNVRPGGSLIDSTVYDGMGGDDYAIDAKGNTVAIVCGDSYFDMFLLKSTDNGTTWTKTVIEAFPIPHFVSADGISDVNGDGVADTINACDGSVAVLLDNNGQAHVWYGRTRIIDDTPGDKSWSYFPATNGLMYWNESMSTPAMITGALDLNSNGYLDFDTIPCASGVSPFGSYGGSLSSHPSAGISANGWIYMSYDAVVEETNDGSTPCYKAYRHVYMMLSTDGGVTWTQPYDLFNDPLSECVFGSMGRNVSSTEGPCVIYYQDDAPGFGVNNNTIDVANDGKSHDIVYACAPEILGVIENSTSGIQSTLFPNPAHGNATLEVISASSSKATVAIYNAVGQKVKEFSNNMVAGKNIVHLDLNKLSTGLYTVTVVAGNSITSSKLIVE